MDGTELERIEQLELLLKKVNNQIELLAEQNQRLVKYIEENETSWGGSADFKVTLILVNDVKKNNQTAIVDETKYVDTMAEAQKLKAEIFKRKELYKRKVLIATQLNFDAVPF